MLFANKASKEVLTQDYGKRPQRLDRFLTGIGIICLCVFMV